MTTINRRRFLQASGLGPGALLLAPTVNSLLSQAHGAVTVPRRVVFLVQGNGMNSVHCVAPPEYRADPPNTRIDSTSFTLPNMMTALAPYRSRLLLLDRLTNFYIAGNGHTKGYTGMSCVPNTIPDSVGPPGGITIDQQLAQTIGKDSPWKSVVLGVSNDPAAKLLNHVSAAAANEPVPAQCSARDAFTRLFGSVMGTQDPNELLAKRLMHDTIKGQIAVVKSRLGPAERIPLDQMLTHVEEVQKKLLLQASPSGAVSTCITPETPSGNPEDIEDRLSAQFDNAAAALVCNLTPVVTITSTPGLEHFGVSYRKLGVPERLHSIGHTETAEGYAMLDTIHNFHASLLAKLMSKLEAVKEGNGTMLDNTLIVWTSDNSWCHHGDGRRWPFVVLGDLNGHFKGQGRYLRFAEDGKKPRLHDFYFTIARALGAGIDSFAAGKTLVPDILS